MSYIRVNYICCLRFWYISFLQSIFLLSTICFIYIYIFLNKFVFYTTILFQLISFRSGSIQGLLFLFSVEELMFHWYRLNSFNGIRLYNNILKTKINTYQWNRTTSSSTNDIRSKACIYSRVGNGCWFQSQWWVFNSHPDCSCCSMIENQLSIVRVFYPINFRMRWFRANWTP